MTIQRYSVNQHPVQTLLTWIESDEIAISEIQRPFVWNAAKVRDFIDSLYFGYPVGYLIAWRNPSVRLKDGTESKGKRILIDGQQRVTALLAAMLGRSIVDKNYRKVRITIAFHPGEERFEVTNPAIRRDRAWLPDIASLFAPGTKLLRVVDAYCEGNAEANRDEIYERIERLRGILNNSLGLIELNADLDVETVSEIFVRINSQGVPLNAADFAMSKMAANERYNGHQLRKCIDYFCHLAVAPEAYADLASNSEFAGEHPDPDVPVVEVLHQVDEMAEIAPEAIEPPDDDHVSLPRRLEEGGEPRAVLTLSGRLVLVDRVVADAGLAQSIPLQVEALGTVRLRYPRVADQHRGLQNDRFCDT